MIALLFLMALLFPFSAASSDTDLVCAIDMGSNTFKLILGEMQEGNYVQHHFTKTRLGVGDDMSNTGVISPPKLKEIRQTLQKYWLFVSRREFRRLPPWPRLRFVRQRTRTMS